jgi:hypothetical protein
MRLNNIENAKQHFSCCTYPLKLEFIDNNQIIYDQVQADDEATAVKIADQFFFVEQANGGQIIVNYL